MRCSDGFCGLARGRFVKLVDVGAVIARRRLPLRVDPLCWEAIDSWLEATARSMGALRWNSSAAITKCSLTMWRGETVYDVIVEVKINNASRAAIGLGP